MFDGRGLGYYKETESSDSTGGHVNVTQLRTFTMVVEYGSFSSAARQMHLSQPAVTMQVQALEAELGVTLLDRQYRRVELTEAGSALLPYAMRVLSDLEEAREVVAGLSGRVTGHLLLSASTTPGQYVLPNLLGAFLKEYAGVGVSLAVADTVQVIEAVAAGDVHLGMTGAQIRGAKVVFEQLGTDDLVMICPPDHPFATASSLTISEVVEAPFIMREEGSGTRLITEEVLLNAGVDPGDLHVVTELGTGEAILSAVEGGLGIAVLSHWVASKAIELGTVGVVPVAEFPVSRPLYLVLPRASMTRAASAFVDHLRERLGEGSDD
jgi:DNA-binding transcriptional LysR family regulator